MRLNVGDVMCYHGEKSVCDNYFELVELVSTVINGRYWEVKVLTSSFSPSPGDSVTLATEFLMMYYFKC